MDHQNNEQKTGGEEIKRSPYEDLSKEDLIKRCKKLLSIAHEAKQVINELQAENETIKQKLENLETQKAADKNSLVTLQELVESLTEQKLKFATDIDHLRTTNTHLSNEKCALESKIEEQETLISSLKARSQELECLDSENTSYKRQNVRLQEENEGLISQLDCLEKEIQELNRIGLMQREQLLLLEQNSENVGDSEKQKDKLDALLSENKRLLEELEEKTEKNIDKEKILEEYIKKLTETQKLYETERETKDKLNTKIKSYREKIIRCSSCITQLKNSRFVLLKTVKEYAQSIPEWQSNLAGVSKMLNEQHLTLIAENKKLKEELSHLQGQSVVCTQCDVHKTSIVSLQSQIVLKSEEIERLLEETNKKCLNCDKLKDKNKSLNARVEELETELGNESNNQILLDQITSLETEKLSLLKEKQHGKDLLQTEQSKLEECLETISKLKSDLNTRTRNLDALHEEKKRLLALLEENNDARQKASTDLEIELRKIQADFTAIEKENRTLLDENELLKDEVNTLKISLEQPNDVSQVNESLQADILKLENKVASYKAENSSINAELKECRQRLQDFEEAKFEVEDVQCQLVAAKMENAELLNEMKEITQALKERGETISKQTKALSDSEKVMESLEEELSGLKSAQKDVQGKLVAMAIEMEQNQVLLDSLKLENERLKEESERVRILNEDLMTLNSEKEDSLIMLREEVDRAKQQNNSFCDARADEMSNSTISRAEDLSRMKELDDSFEERYNRLKTLAVKLKKRVTELTAQLETSEKERSRLETEKPVESVNNQSPATAKNIQSMHQECDRLADKLEESETEVKSLRKEKDRMSEELESVTKQVEKLKTQLDTSSQEKQALQISMTEFQQQVKSLKKDLDDVKSKDLEITKLKSELAAKELLVSAELEQHRVTKEQLDKAKKDVKKRSVLSLEMADYERSMKDLTTKMEDNKKKMVQMESTIDTQQATINTLKTQIKLLDEQIKSEEIQCRSLKEEVQESSQQLKDKEALVNSKNDFIAKLERDLEEFKSANEELSLQMASQLGEKETTIVSLSQEKMELSIRVKRTESRCNELDESIRLKTIELDDMKTEFASYKVRAQSVLRQNQVVDHSQEERLKEETAALRAEVEGLKKQLQQASIQLASSASALSEERRHAAEAADTAARAAERAARLHADTTSVADQLQADNKQLQLQLSMLTQCYKKQISDLEERLRTETEELQRQVEAASAREGHKPIQTLARDDGSDGDADISVALMPREEGEGSEWAPSPPHAPSSRRSPLSLERLLQEGVSEELPGDMSGHGLSLEQELAELRRKLETQVQRVKHGTLLLDETEREAARLRQEGALLKTELRRAQASLERTQHAHNAEYMKNVMIKFVTLPPGDERARLVPVLQKILTLTQDETHQVQAVAKGGDPNSNKGWGSYLPWPGGR